MLPIEKIAEECAGFGINLDNLAKERLDRYASLLLEWSQKMNLTAITQPEEIAEKHFLDCLYLFKFCRVEQQAKWIDVGTGAGFPGIVLKIARPDIQLTLLDGLNKRLLFLQEVLAELGLSAERLHLRAEEGGRQPELREAFDYATARAVARLPALAEYCMPFVRCGGHFLCMKGPAAEEELMEAEKAISLLGGEPGGMYPYQLPGGDARTIIDVKKISHTPAKYPRQGVKITKKPL